MIDRRSFVSGILATCAAPVVHSAAIVRAESLMIVRKRIWEPGIYHDGRLLFHAAPGVLPILAKKFITPSVDGCFWLSGESGSNEIERVLGAPARAFIERVLEGETSFYSVPFGVKVSSAH